MPPKGCYPWLIAGTKWVATYKESAGAKKYSKRYFSIGVEEVSSDRTFVKLSFKDVTNAMPDWLIEFHSSGNCWFVTEGVDASFEFHEQIVKNPEPQVVVIDGVKVKEGEKVLIKNVPRFALHGEDDWIQEGQIIVQFNFENYHSYGYYFRKMTIEEVSDDKRYIRLNPEFSQSMSDKNEKHCAKVLGFSKTKLIPVDFLKSVSGRIRRYEDEVHITPPVPPSIIVESVQMNSGKRTLLISVNEKCPCCGKHNTLRVAPHMSQLEKTSGEQTIECDGCRKKLIFRYWNVPGNTVKDRFRWNLFHRVI